MKLIRYEYDPMTHFASTTENGQEKKDLLFEADSYSYVKISMRYRHLYDADHKPKKLPLLHLLQKPRSIYLPLF